MGIEKRGLHSCDPQDHLSHALAQLRVPRGHTNANLDLRDLRLRMGMTQVGFAHQFGFPVATLRHWERGTRKPTGTALVLLHVIRNNPRVVWLAVRKAGLQRPLVAPTRAPPGYGQRAPVRRPRGPRRAPY